MASLETRPRTGPGLVALAAFVFGLPQVARGDGAVLFLLDASGSMNSGFSHCNPQSSNFQVVENADPSPFKTLEMSGIPEMGRGPMPKARFSPVKVRAGSRIERAREIITRLAGEYASRGFREAIMAFGHLGRGGGCHAIEVVVPFADGGEQEVTSAANSMIPHGVTPLARAMQKAGEELAKEDSSQPRHLVVISDGGENCGGDPVEAAAELRRSFKVSVHIIALDMCGSQLAQLKAVAKAGGGSFSQDDVGESFVQDAVKASAAIGASAAANARPFVSNQPPPGSAPVPARVGGPVKRTQPGPSGDPISSGGASDVSIDGAASGATPPILPPVGAGGSESTTSGERR